MISGNLTNRLQKSFFAMIRAGRALLVAKHQHVALAAEQLAHSLTCQSPRGAIVGRDEAHVRFVLQVRVEDDDRHLGVERRLHRRGERGVVQRREHDAGHALRREALHQVHLGLEIVFLERSFPNHFHVHFTRGLLGAGVDRFPKLVRRALGDDGDAKLGRRVRSRLLVQR